MEHTSIDYNLTLVGGIDDYHDIAFVAFGLDGQPMETTAELDAALDRIIPSLFESDFKDVKRGTKKTWVRRHHHVFAATGSEPPVAMCQIQIHWDDWYGMRHRGLRKIFRDHPWRFVSDHLDLSHRPQPVYHCTLTKAGRTINRGLSEGSKADMADYRRDGERLDEAAWNTTERRRQKAARQAAKEAA